MVHLRLAFVKHYRMDRTGIMALSSYVLEGRAHLLARIKVIFDLLLALGLYASGAPLLFLLAPAIDLLLLIPYLRYVKRSPALLTFVTVGFSAVLLALAPLALGAYGLALWVLFPLTPASAGFVLTRRPLLWQMAVITAAVLAFGTFLLLRSAVVLTFDRLAVAVLAVVTLTSTLLAAWFMARMLRQDAGSRDLLGEPLTVVRGVMVVPLNWVAGGVQSDPLRLELNDLKRQQSPRWIVLDLAPAGQIGRHDLNAVERAAEQISNMHCTVVIARPSVDAIGHLDVAQPVIGRIERFATVPQAVEAGLRRLGWVQQSDQARRVVTTY